MNCPKCGGGDFGPILDADGQEIDGHDKCPDCGYEEKLKDGEE